MMQFRFRLKELRKKSGFSQEELAEKLSLSRSTITAYESGTRTPPVETLINIADFFGVSVDYLLGRKDDPCLNYGSSTTIRPLVKKLQDQILRLNFTREKNELEVIDKHIELSLRQVEAWLNMLKK